MQFIEMASPLCCCQYCKAVFDD